MDTSEIPTDLLRRAFLVGVAGPLSEVGTETSDGGREDGRGAAGAESVGGDVDIVWRLLLAGAGAVAVEGSEAERETRGVESETSAGVEEDETVDVDDDDDDDDVAAATDEDDGGEECEDGTEDGLDKEGFAAKDGDDDKAAA